MLSRTSIFTTVVALLLGLFFFINGFFLNRNELGIISESSILQIPRKYFQPSLKDRMRWIGNSANIFYSNSGDEVKLEDLFVREHSKSKSENLLDDSLIIVQQVPLYRVFFFIIDALRLDFVTNESSNLASIQNLLATKPSNSMLLGFRGESPTVTSQRLKALTTGTLPTFIDIGSNFNSAFIKEDNIIDQIRNNRRYTENEKNGWEREPLICMGDDTWASLYPTQFDRSFLFDSFNTNDLYTVDNGIMEHLFREMNGNWSLFVAHFLGVDHVGHSYHARHELMTEKIKLMDSLIAEVVSKLPEDALLFVFGDHGMTDSGEHGGASLEETDSALFIYSPSPIFEVQCEHPESLQSCEAKYTNSDNCSVRYWDERTGHFEWQSVSAMRSSPRMVSQIDLVPTISMLLGIPIPFSSIGMVIPEMFISRSSGEANLRNSSKGGTVTVDWDNFLDIVFINALQVWEYFVTYSNPSLSASRAFSANSIDVEDRIVTNFSVRPSTHITEPLRRLEEKLISAVELHISLLNSKNASEINSELFNSVCGLYIQFMTECQIYARQQWTEFGISSMVFGLAVMTITLIWFSFYFCKSNKVYLPSDSVSLVIPILFLFHAVSVFSNSFIAEEHWVSFFLFQSGNWYIGMEVLSSTLSRSKQFLLRDKLCMVSAVILSVVLTRITWDHQINSVSQKYTSVSDNLTVASNSSELLACLAFLAGKFFILNCKVVHMRKLTNTLSILILIISEMLLCLYWTVKSNHHAVVAIFRVYASQDEQWLLTWLPRSQLACFVSALVVLSLGQRHAGHNLAGYLAHVCVHFSSLVGLYSGPRAHTLLHVTAFHLVLLYSSTLGVLVEGNGDGEQRLVNQAWRWINCYLHINSAGRYLFFITGHRFEFSKLQLSVGFIGNENFNFVYAGICLAINTFGYDILAILAYHTTALLVMDNSHRRQAISTKSESGRHRSDDGSGTGRRETFHISAVCCWYRITLLCCSCFAAALHRRHLMVWAVFAPKLAFESAQWIVGALILTILSFLIERQLRINI